MDYREMDDEYEINLKALLITICQKWRLIVVCTVACAVLGCGFKFFKETKAAATDPAEEFVTEDAVKLDANIFGLSPTDGSMAGRFRTAIANYEDLIQRAAEDESYLPAALANKQAVEEMRAGIVEARDYLENSLSYLSNTSTGSTCNIQLVLEGLGRKSGNDLENAALIYSAFLKNDDLYAELAERWDTQPRFITENVGFSAPQLYSSDSDSSNMVATVAQSDTEEEQYGRTLVLNVSVTAENRERADELKDYVVAALEDYRDSNADLSDYRLAVEQITYQTPYARYLQEDQDNNMLYYAQMEALSAQYDAFCAANADLIEAVEGVPGGATGEELHQALKEVADGSVSKRDLLKFALIGAFVGLFGSMGVLAVYYVMRGVILSEDDINDMFLLRPLGTLRSAQSGRHHTKLDKWLWNSKEDANYRGMGESERYDVMQTKIRTYAGEDARSFLLVGTSDKDPLEEIAHKLGTRMRDCSFATTTLLNGTKESLDSLEASDGVVLVLNVANSRHQMIANDIETAHYYSKPIVGTIAVL